MIAMVQATLPSPPETLRPMMKGKLLPFRHGHEYAAHFRECSCHFAHIG